MKTYTYKINSDAYMMKVYATNMDDAARKLAATEPLLAKSGVTDLASLLAYIESIEGAWLWIESDDAPDGNRQYAGMAIGCVSVLVMIVCSLIQVWSCYAN